VRSWTNPGENSLHYALLSDVHGRRQKLAAVLSDAQSRGADQIVSLGDVGGPGCLALLQEAGALAVFGNYEVSGWRQLAKEHRGWVQRWPPFLAGDGFLAVHAAPGQPESLSSVEDFGHWLKTTRLPWRSLFPYLLDEQDLWPALAELEAADQSLLFHGHTHRQAIWCLRKGGRLQRLPVETVQVKLEHSYVVGVGSVGLPEDDCWAAYTLYDAQARRIEPIRLHR
jgi:predicted phosphodiesterase